MDQEKRGDRIETGKNFCQDGQGVCGNSKNLVEGVVYETVVKNPEENVCFGGENADLGLQNDGFGLCKQQEMGISGNSSSLVDGNVLDNREKDLGVGETPVEVDQRSSGSLDNSANGLVVVETIVVINTQEAAACSDGSNGVLEVKDNELGSSKVLEGGGPKRKVAAEAEDDSYVIDMKGIGGGGGGGRRKLKESWDGERVCRICLLNSEQSLESNDSTSTTESAMDLIQLGCGCKDELGIAHNHCAEAWFKLKGNRMCEICGQTAKNVTGVLDNRFIEDWHDQGSSSGGVSSSSVRGVGCWRGQPFCNFVMACLVIAFVLPWFFRVNMF